MILELSIAQMDYYCCLTLLFHRGTDWDTTCTHRDRGILWMTNAAANGSHRIRSIYCIWQWDGIDREASDIRSLRGSLLAEVAHKSVTDRILLFASLHRQDPKIII